MNANKLQHVEMDQFSARDNELCLAGKPISEITQLVGDTPYFAYDATVIEQRLRQLKEQLPANIKIHYAIKANPLPELLTFMASRVDGFDVASVAEMRWALQTGMSAQHISIAGPAKKSAHLREVINADCTINLESSDELQRAIDVSQAVNKKPRLAIRVNPAFELKSSGMKMGGGAKPFGIDAERVPELLQRMQAMAIDFQGFHIFSGSQNLHAESIIEAQNLSVQLALDLSRQTHFRVPRINIGGGFGIPYFPGDQRLDLDPILQNLKQISTRVHAELGDCEIVLELGRFLVGECGVYICRVLEKKVSRNETFLITDGGLHHHLAASGNFGQVIRKNYPLAIANRLHCNQTQTCHVVGPLCTPLDILGHKVSLCAPQVGDLVVVYQSGAYAASASPMAFLGHPPAREIFLCADLASADR